VDLDPSDLLDADGRLRRDVNVTLPELEHGYLVFGQESPFPFELGTLRAYASRFLEAKVGFSVEKKGPPRVNDLALVLVHHARFDATVTVVCRAAIREDLELAERAEALAGGGGLASLAARCPRVFEVHGGASGAEERASLLVACLLAGTSLGPVLTPDGASIFGVKSGRARLEAWLTQDGAAT
jgi:hypothetical protein